MTNAADILQGYIQDYEMLVRQQEQLDKTIKAKGQQPTTFTALHMYQHNLSVLQDVQKTLAKNGIL